MSKTGLLILLGVLGLAAVGGGAAAQQETAVPDAMLGTWAKDGACAEPAAQLLIAPGEASRGGEAPRAVIYRHDDPAPGEGALAWVDGDAEETFLYDATEDVILRQGPDGSETFKRCE